MVRAPALAAALPVLPACPMLRLLTQPMVPSLPPAAAPEARAGLEAGALRCAEGEEVEASP